MSIDKLPKRLQPDSSDTVIIDGKFDGTSRVRTYKLFLSMTWANGSRQLIEVRQHLVPHRVLDVTPPAVALYRSAGTQSISKPIRIAYRFASNGELVHIPKPRITMLPEEVTTGPVEEIERKRLADDLWEVSWNVPLYFTPTRYTTTRNRAWIKCEIAHPSGNIDGIKVPLSYGVSGIKVSRSREGNGPVARTTVLLSSLDGTKFEILGFSLEGYDAHVVYDDRRMRTFHKVIITPFEEGTAVSGRIVVYTSHPDSHSIPIALFPRITK